MLCIQKEIPRENLKHIPFVHADGSPRYQPIPHHVLADSIVNETNKIGLSIKSERWGIAHDDASLFGEIVLDEDNSKIVKYIFSKMNSLIKNPKLTKSKRTRRLLKLLQNRNFTYNGKPFTRWNVRDILNNTFYFGELKYGEIKTNHNYQPIISKRLFNQICIG